MWGQVDAHNWRFSKLWISGFIIHVITLFFVIDLYFKSPINHGMTPHKSSAPPFAKRIVLFIADGLRAEAIYKKKNEHRTPYLTNLRKTSAAWGTVHTRVPTESRPGHVAILGGLYEDPSAIFTGWKANIVEFDSVINQSTNTWSFGSPDIVKIFPKHDKSNLFVEAYEPEYEDFSGSTSTINLDTWVFNKIDELLKLEGNNCNAAYQQLRFAYRKLTRKREKLESQRKECDTFKLWPDRKLYKMMYYSCILNHNHEEGLVHLDQIEMEQEYMNMRDSCLPAQQLPQCGRLCQSGNIFFLHLLGMDSAGHVHKPDSKEYINNLKAVDEGVKQTVELFYDFYNDNETVFLFTSDHGMTNWGSHGDGSQDETEVPYILWGQGVNTNYDSYDMTQADLAPLIASLIGIPIPINSVGILHHTLLGGTSVQRAEAVHANLRQLSEHYLLLKESYLRDTLFFKEYREFVKDPHLVQRTLNEVRSLSEHDTDTDSLLIQMATQMIRVMMDSLQYMRNYYFIPKIFCIFSGFIMWMVYLAISLNNSTETVTPEDLDSYAKMRRVTRWTLLGVTITFYAYFIKIGASKIAYGYLAFPVTVALYFVESDNIVKRAIYIKKHMNWREIMFRILFFGIIIELLVVGFFKRHFCGFVLTILAVWLFQWKKVKGLVNYWWLFSCLILASFLFLNSSTKFDYYGLYVGACAWGIYYIYFVFFEWKDFIISSRLKCRFSWIGLAILPLLIFFIAIGNTYHVARSFDNYGGVHFLNRIISWVLTVVTLVLIPISPTGILVKFGQLCAYLIIPFTLMSINLDLLYYTTLTLTLYYWILMESQVYSSSSDPGSQNYQYNLDFGVTMTSFHSYRRTFFYLALSICYFFGIGNVASFNGFDPLWTRAYVSTFNPVLMFVLIIFKMIIPYFIITCAFVAVNILTCANTTNIFTILMLFLDQLVLNFMFFIKNEGSWKEIGTSLSHFVVMEFMAVVMLCLYAVATYVTSATLGNCGMYEHPKEDQVVSATQTEIVTIAQEEVQFKNELRRRVKALPPSTGVKIPLQTSPKRPLVPLKKKSLSLPQKPLRPISESASFPLPITEKLIEKPIVKSSKSMIEDSPYIRSKKLLEEPASNLAKYVPGKIPSFRKKDLLEQPIVEAAENVPDNTENLQEQPAVDPTKAFEVLESNEFLKQKLIEEQKNQAEQNIEPNTCFDFNNLPLLMGNLITSEETYQNMIKLFEPQLEPKREAGEPNPKPKRSKKKKKARSESSSPTNSEFSGYGEECMVPKFEDARKAGKMRDFKYMFDVPHYDEDQTLPPASEPSFMHDDDYNPRKDPELQKLIREQRRKPIQEEMVYIDPLAQYARHDPETESEESWFLRKPKESVDFDPKPKLRQGLRKEQVRKFENYDTQTESEESYFVRKPKKHVQSEPKPKLKQGLRREQVKKHENYDTETEGEEEWFERKPKQDVERHPKLKSNQGLRKEQVKKFEYIDTQTESEETWNIRKDETPKRYTGYDPKLKSTQGKQDVECHPKQKSKQGLRKEQVKKLEYIDTQTESEETWNIRKDETPKQYTGYDPKLKSTQGLGKKQVEEYHDTKTKSKNIAKTSEPKLKSKQPLRKQQVKEDKHPKNYPTANYPTEEDIFGRDEDYEDIGDEVEVDEQLEDGIHMAIKYDIEDDYVIEMDDDDNDEDSSSDIKTDPELTDFQMESRETKSPIHKKKKETKQEPKYLEYMSRPYDSRQHHPLGGAKIEKSSSSDIQTDSELVEFRPISPVAKSTTHTTKKEPKHRPESKYSPTHYDSRQLDPQGGALKKQNIAKQSHHKQRSEPEYEEQYDPHYYDPKEKKNIEKEHRHRRSHEYESEYCDLEEQKQQKHKLRIKSKDEDATLRQYDPRYGDVQESVPKRSIRKKRSEQGRSDPDELRAMARQYDETHKGKPESKERKAIKRQYEPHYSETQESLHMNTTVPKQSRHKRISKQEHLETWSGQYDLKYSDDQAESKKFTKQSKHRHRSEEHLEAIPGEYELKYSDVQDEPKRDTLKHSKRKYRSEEHLEAIPGQYDLKYSDVQAESKKDTLKPSKHRHRSEEHLEAIPGEYDLKYSDVQAESKKDTSKQRRRSDPEFSKHRHRSDPEHKEAVLRERDPEGVVSVKSKDQKSRIPRRSSPIQQVKTEDYFASSHTPDDPKSVMGKYDPQNLDPRHAGHKSPKTTKQEPCLQTQLQDPSVEAKLKSPIKITKITKEYDPFFRTPRDKARLPKSKPDDQVKQNEPDEQLKKPKPVMDTYHAVKEVVSATNKPELGLQTKLQDPSFETKLKRPAKISRQYDPSHLNPHDSTVVKQNKPGDQLKQNKSDEAETSFVKQHLPDLDDILKQYEAQCNAAKDSASKEQVISEGSKPKQYDPQYLDPQIVPETTEQEPCLQTQDPSFETKLKRPAKVSRQYDPQYHHAVEEMVSETTKPKLQDPEAKLKSPIKITKVTKEYDPFFRTPRDKGRLRKSKPDDQVKQNVLEDQLKRDTHHAVEAIVSDSTKPELGLETQLQDTSVQAKSPIKVTKTTKEYDPFFLRPRDRARLKADEATHHAAKKIVTETCNARKKWRKPDEQVIQIKTDDQEKQNQPDESPEVWVKNFVPDLDNILKQIVQAQQNIGSASKEQSVSKDLKPGQSHPHAYASSIEEGPKPIIRDDEDGKPKIVEDDSEVLAFNLDAQLEKKPTPEEIRRRRKQKENKQGKHFRRRNSLPILFEQDEINDDPQPTATESSNQESQMLCSLEQKVDDEPKPQTRLELKQKLAGKHLKHKESETNISLEENVELIQTFSTPQCVASTAELKQPVASTSKLALTVVSTSELEHYVSKSELEQSVTSTSALKHFAASTSELIESASESPKTLVRSKSLPNLNESVKELDEEQVLRKYSSTSLLEEEQNDSDLRDSFVIEDAEIPELINWLDRKHMEIFGKPPTPTPSFTKRRNWDNFQNPM